MKVEELLMIRKFKNEFRDKFGRELCIDYLAMNGLHSELKMLKARASKTAFKPEMLTALLQKHSVDLEVFKTNSKIKKNRPDGYNNFMKEYCQLIITNQWNMSECMSLISRDRSCIYYHLKLGKYAKRKEEEELEKVF